MSVIVSNMNIPSGCQKCKFFKKYAFGNGLDYSYSCILGAKGFPMPWIRQMDERANDCPIEPLEQEPKTGHWINYKDEHQCSQCGETVIADMDVWEEYSYDFCPSCGAEMER